MGFHHLPLVSSLRAQPSRIVLPFNLQQYILISGSAHCVMHLLTSYTICFNKLISGFLFFVFFLLLLRVGKLTPSLLEKWGIELTRRRVRFFFNLFFFPTTTVTEAVGYEVNFIVPETLNIFLSFILSL